MPAFIAHVQDWTESRPPNCCTLQVQKYMGNSGEGLLRTFWHSVCLGHLGCMVCVHGAAHCMQRYTMMLTEYCGHEHHAVAEYGQRLSPPCHARFCLSEFTLRSATKRIPTCVHHEPVSFGISMKCEFLSFPPSPVPRGSLCVAVLRDCFVIHGHPIVRTSMVYSPPFQNVHARVCKSSLCSLN